VNRVGLSDGDRIPLRGGQSLELHATGLRRVGGGRERFTPYAELIHVAVSPRGLRIGSEHGTLLVPRSAFAEPGAQEELSRRLQLAMASLPDGEQRRLRHERLDRRQAARSRPTLGLALAALCVAFHVLSRALPTAASAGEYWRVLGLTGEPWRLVTAQLLHAGLPHLFLNALGLVALGALLERQIGASRSWLVAVASGAGAMLGSALAGYEIVVGASGVVMGFAGALLALELRRPDLLPVQLRLPRGLLIGAVTAELVVMSFVPDVANAAHAGGLVLGGLVALATAPADASRFAAGPVLRGASSAALASVLFALGSYAWVLLDPAPAASRRGARMLDERSAPALLLNNDAWTIATAGDATPEDLEVALRLARRAVRATQRLEPNLLDTLAEVYFQLGRSEDALAVIDEAIALAPGESYYEEQRRRFSGERAPDDRPAPPEAEPAPPGREPESRPDAPSIRV
jgi:membrane associated rhomboid family serine protease